MTIANLKLKARDFLSNDHERNKETFAIDALLTHVLDKQESFLLAYPEYELKNDELENFWVLLESFRKGVPLAYLTKCKEFYGMQFFVNKNVLIPRPESELIVDLVKKFVQDIQLKSNLSVLDVGTGSGNLIISIVAELSKKINLKGLGIDISKEALEVAKYNAKKNQMADHIAFLQSDLLQEVNGEFDIIVANLPYIGIDCFNFVAKNVADFEPNIALFGGGDGLELYRKMFEQLNRFSWKPKLMLGEFGFGQAEALSFELNKFFPHTKWKILQDYALIERIFMVDFR